MATEYLTVDAAGRRATPQPVAVDKAPRMIVLLGASAMWGYTGRDGATIAAELAARLPAAGIHHVAVVNLSQPGYTLGHELAALQYELGRGRVPAMAVFYDGINDIRTAHLYGEPGHAFFEALRQDVRGGRHAPQRAHRVPRIGEPSAHLGPDHLARHDGAGDLRSVEGRGRHWCRRPGRLRTAVLPVRAFETLEMP
jgi:lysophospholipase L1-like esterase